MTFEIDSWARSHMDDYVVSPSDGVHMYLEHEGGCGAVVCTIDPGDGLGLLAEVAASHVCTVEQIELTKRLFSTSLNPQKETP